MQLQCYSAAARTQLATASKRLVREWARRAARGALETNREAHDASRCVHVAPASMAALRDLRTDTPKPANLTRALVLTRRTRRARGEWRRRGRPACVGFIISTI